MEQPELCVSDILATLSGRTELAEFTLRCDPLGDPVDTLKRILRVLYVLMLQSFWYIREAPTVRTSQVVSSERLERFSRLLSHTESLPSGQLMFPQPEALVRTTELSPSQVQRYQRLIEGTTVPGVMLTTFSTEDELPLVSYPRPKSIWSLLRTTTVNLSHLRRQPVSNWPCKSHFSWI